MGKERVQVELEFPRGGPMSSTLRSSFLFPALALLVACDEGHDKAQELNRAPAAKLSISGERKVNSTITFDGRASSDRDGDPLTHEWTLVARPAGSKRAPTDMGKPRPGLAVLVPDQDGFYRVRLTVSDGHLSATASVAVRIGDPT